MGLSDNHRSDEDEESHAQSGEPPLDASSPSHHENTSVNHLTCLMGALLCHKENETLKVGGLQKEVGELQKEVKVLNTRLDFMLEFVINVMPTVSRGSTGAYTDCWEVNCSLQPQST
jgi:hypothetical protein